MVHRPGIRQQQCLMTGKKAVVPTRLPFQLAGYTALFARPTYLLCQCACQDSVSANPTYLSSQRACQADLPAKPACLLCLLALFFSAFGRSG